MDVPFGHRCKYWLPNIIVKTTAQMAEKNASAAISVIIQKHFVVEGTYCQLSRSPVLCVLYAELGVEI